MFFHALTDQAMDQTQILEPQPSSQKDRDTFYKLVISKKDKTILGIHIISDDAAELIQLLAVNVVARNTLDDFKKTVAVHPTSSEEIITI